MVQTDHTYHTYHTYPNFDNLSPTSLASIPIYCMYIDQEQEIIKISVNHHSLPDKVITKNQLLKLVHCNSITHNDSKYCFRNMMLYHIHHDKSILEHICNDNDDHDDNDDSASHFKDSLHEVNIYKDLIIPDSLPIFHDINSILVFFHEKKSSLKHNRHSIDNNSGTSNARGSITTKRVRIRDIPNKTRRCK